MGALVLFVYLAIVFVIFVIAAVIAFSVLIFLILLISSLAGFISGSITKNPLKGLKIFFIFLGTIFGYLSGFLFLIVISMIFKEIKMPVSFVETLPASLIGAFLGLLSALVINKVLDKLYKLIQKRKE